jgi:tetratricopeptide (TPR) repeat protein
VLDQALSLHRKGRLDEAAALYREMLAQNPRDADALHLLGAIAFQRKNPAAAVELIGQAIAIAPDNAGFLSNLGLALVELRRFEDALASYDRAVAIEPRFAEAHYNRGIALERLKRLDNALASYGRALAIKPGYADALVNRGFVLRELKRPGEALADYDRSLALRPDFPEALNNRGIALGDLRRFDEALASYDRSLALRPDYPEALNNRGVALAALKRLDDALASYDQALALRPDYAEALYNRGMARLLCGDYRQGWADYEWRLKSPDAAARPPKVTARDWQGEDLAGRSILIYIEQGLGDIIQFARFLPLLIRRGATVSFYAPAKLTRLLRALSPDIEFIATIERPRNFDFQCALMSLPLRLAADLGPIPNQVPYLKPEPELVAHWTQRIGDAGFKIGIVWQGNPQVRNDAGRSFPLAALAPLSRLPGVRLIALQKHDGLDQLMRLPPGTAVETLGEEFDSGADAFIDTAAVMSNLDLIVTADTATAHLAGALARPAWVALEYVPDWRWLLDRNDSPWYPTLRLFRQQSAGDWKSVFSAIESELRALLAWA